ncbi:MAG: bifunctional 3-demethylubiquinone-9 3-methyltransferase/ 2-octaprenyl-6-hydroxy phenol methylase [Methanosaeta sp. PtaB.Bin018]|nr:MAG: bifunctional 3-demethylubiquinone-9 3-methyltransferase/ 2-octaprenyl-6-hydroxy phenol methylase [Methanosaeta sp. PtaB.Bin018]
MTSEFDVQKYYASYPCRVILRPGYPARAQYKSRFMWDHYSQQIVGSLKEIRTYADIGGCFGFGANSMAFQIFKFQGKYPETKVFEISPDFINIGKQLFPYIDFVQNDFRSVKETQDIFDLVTMFDVIEHIPDPTSFLSTVARHARFALIITPMEAGGIWLWARRPVKQGAEHEDGHVNFFTPETYLELLKKSGLELIDGKCVHAIAPQNAEYVLHPEAPSHEKPLVKRIGITLLDYKLFPYYIVRKIIGGGVYICLVRSNMI